MSENKIIKPSISLLPMEDIAQVLNIQYSFPIDDPINGHPFVAKKAESIGNLKEKDIAKNLDGEEETQNYVKGALCLLEKSNDENTKYKEYKINELMKKEEYKNELSAVNNHNDDIRDLRDELYMLKAELQKEGFLKQVEPYSGFIDVFKSNNIKYVKAQDSSSLKFCDVKRIIGPSSFELDSIEDFHIGEYFIIHLIKDNYTLEDKIKSLINSSTDPELLKKEINNLKQTNSEFEYNELKHCTGSYDSNYVLETITDIDKDNKIIVFNKPIEGLNENNVEILKTAGTYYNGSFSNSILEKDGVENKNHHVSLLDDTNSKNVVINKNNSGYASLVKIPKESKGILSIFRIKGRAVGSPGNLVCYIIDEDYVNNFKNIAQAIEDKKLIGISDSINASEHQKENDIVFTNFTDFNGNKVLLQDQKYCFIIHAKDTNEYGNHWEIKFVYHLDPISGGQDVQLNNRVYEFQQVKFEDLNKNVCALTTDKVINSKDLYYELITLDELEEKERPLTKGLYTAQIKLPKPINPLRARLTLRINREGIGRIKPYSNKAANNYIVLNEDDVIEIDNPSLPISNDSTIIIGSNNIKVKKDKSNITKTSKDICLKIGDPVYRMGYDIQIRCIGDSADRSFKTDYHTMKLIGVLPDHHDYNPVAKTNLNSSDRLIFETDFNNIIEEQKEYDKFEIQIKWDTPVLIQELMEHEDYVGRIFDLSLILDRNL